MNKLIETVKRLLEEGQFFDASIGFEKYHLNDHLCGSDFRLNLIEGLAEAERTIDGVQSCWNAYEKLRLVEPKEQWNQALYFILADRKQATKIPSDIGTLEVYVHSDVDDAPSSDYAGAYLVRFSCPTYPLKDGEVIPVYEIFVWVPTYFKSLSQSFLTLDKILKPAIAKAICDTFGLVDIGSIERV